jgi:uncharacterized membrane protein YqhA
MLYRVIAATRFIIVAPAVAIFAAATALLVFDTILTINQIGAMITVEAIDLHSAKAMGFSMLEVVDLLLMSIVMYIISIGLFQLFVARLTLPRVLTINTFEELKEKLVGVIVVVLGVFFLSELAEVSIATDVTPDLIVLGTGLAVVIIALTFFLWQQSFHSRYAGHEVSDDMLVPARPAHARPEGSVDDAA